MNVFVLKQIHLWGFEVTSADVYVIGLLTCLNYAREHYEKNDVNDAMLCSWVISIAVFGSHPATPIFNPLT
ncbi:putative preQ0 transporter [Chlamydia pneumoniae B21]|nr:putative preQ0 transporter [Chlamydia pneumoniae B21]